MIEIKKVMNKYLNGYREAVYFDIKFDKNATDYKIVGKNADVNTYSFFKSIEESLGDNHFFFSRDKIKNGIANLPNIIRLFDGNSGGLESEPFENENPNYDKKHLFEIVYKTHKKD